MLSIVLVLLSGLAAMNDHDTYMHVQKYNCHFLDIRQLKITYFRMVVLSLLLLSNQTMTTDEEFSFSFIHFGCRNTGMFTNKKKNVKAHELLRCYFFVVHNK